MFGSVVIVVNLVMVMRFSNHTGWGESLVYLMILCFPTLMYVESGIGLEIVPELYFMFEVMFMMDMVWIQMIASSLIVVVIDMSYYALYRLLNDDERSIRDEVLKYTAKK